MEHHVIFIETTLEDGLHSVGIHTMSGTETENFVNGPAGYVCSTAGYIKRNAYPAKQKAGFVLIDPETYTEECIVSRHKDPVRNVITGEAMIDLIDTLTCTKEYSYTIITTDPNLVGVISSVKCSDGGRLLSKAQNSNTPAAKVFLKVYHHLMKKRESNITYLTGVDGLDLVGSSKASFLATIGANSNANMVQEFVVEENPLYWKSASKKNPLLALRYIVMSTLDPDRDYIRLATPDKDIYNIGKVAGLTCYGVARLSNLNDYTDVLIKDVYDKVKKSAVVLLDINAVYNKGTSSALEQYRTQVISQHPSNNYEVRFIKDDVPLVEQVSPTNMTLRGFEQTTLIKKMLDKFIEGKLDAGKEEHHIDVTDQIYTEKGKVLPFIRAQGGILNLKMGKLPSKRSTRKTIKIRFKLGNALPTLNAIGQLGSPKTKVTFITWYEQGSNVFSHILAWETPDGYAAFGNTDTNKLYV